MHGPVRLGVLALAVLLGGRVIADDEVRSDAPQARPQVSEDELARRARGEADLGFDLLRLSATDEDALLSPHSISQALAQAWLGARGETAAEMARVLRLEGTPIEALPAATALDQALATRGQNARGRGGAPFRLRSVQSAWGRKGHAFLPAYLDALATHFGAGLRVTDFQADPEAARATINRWVADATEKKVPELLQPVHVKRDTTLVLVNAVYFNAAWSKQFDEAATRPAAFTLQDGSTVQVPTMHVTASMGIGSHDGVRAVQVFYSGHEVSMLILVPERGTLADLERDLTGAKLTALTTALRGGQVSLAMPSFEVRSRFELADALSRAGMPTAFSDQADFSGMDGARTMKIGAVVHEAFADVDEQGTEAAAATAVVMAPTGAAPGAPTPFAVDRPFLFLIQDRATGAVLFLGRVVDPR